MVTNIKTTFIIKGGLEKNNKSISQYKNSSINKPDEGNVFIN